MLYSYFIFSIALLILNWVFMQASFLSLNLHALAESFAKVDLAKRLFIEADLLPTELVCLLSKLFLKITWLTVYSIKLSQVSKYFFKIHFIA